MANWPYEVTLKLKMAGCAILFLGAMPQLIKSAVNELRELDPRLPLNVDSGFQA